MSAQILRLKCIEVIRIRSPLELDGTTTNLCVEKHTFIQFSCD